MPEENGGSVGRTSETERFRRRSHRAAGVTAAYCKRHQLLATTLPSLPLRLIHQAERTIIGRDKTRDTGRARILNPVGDDKYTDGNAANGDD